MTLWLQVLRLVHCLIGYRCLITFNTLQDSDLLYLNFTSCDPLNSTTVTPSDEYDASTLSGMSIFASVVLIVELIIVGVFTIIWLE